MKRYLPEMATFDSRETGFKGCFVIKSKEHAHPLFPHVYYCYNLKKSGSEYIKLNIDSDIDKIEVIEQKNIIIKSKLLKKIKLFISKNERLLVKFYLQEPDSLLSTRDFLDSLISV